MNEIRQYMTFHRGVGEKVVVWSRIAKVPLCMMVAFSAGFGVILARPAVSSSMLVVFCGVFFLACGTAALNSIQERDVDGDSRRTRGRPLVHGAYPVSGAVVLAAMNIGFGLLLLLLSSESRLPVLLGILALVLYNGLYTPLKQLSHAALLFGGVSGALPPYIGWIAAGGAVADPAIIGIVVIFFLWQIPHFCLIQLEYSDDKVEQSRFRNPVTAFSENRVKRIIMIWLSSFVFAIYALAFLPGFLPLLYREVLLVASGAFLLFFLYHLLMRQARPRYRMLFFLLNSFLFCLMLFLAAGTVSVSSLPV